MTPEVLKDAEHRMARTVEAAQHDFGTIRTGRANPALLDRITVEAYGTPMPINQLATVTAPEARTLLVAPFDRSQLGAIEKAIRNSDLGISPSNDGNVIRLSIPQLTEERRKEFIKILHKKAEDAKVAVRNVRRDANEHLKDLEKKHEISEDENKRTQEQVQKATDKYIEQIDKLQAAKEKELMEV